MVSVCVGGRRVAGCCNWRVLRPGTPCTVALAVGECVLDRGDHPHGTTPIEAGERVALIVWLVKTGD